MIKFTVRLVTNESFPVSIEESSSVLQVKQQIHELRGEGFEPTALKLVHAGKVLRDEQTLAEVGIKEGGFVVCMVSKVKAGGAPAPAPAPVAAPAPAPVAAPSPAPAAPAPATSPAVAGPPFAGPEFEAGVTQLKEMGFPESEVRVALKAAFGAVDRAADFLMSGHIPDSAIAAADAAIARGGAPAPAPAGAPAAADGALAALRRHPQINEMRAIVQSNPGALPALLAQIGQQSPQLLELIQANQQEFVAMMNEPIDEEGGGGEDDDGDDDMAGGMEGDAGEAGEVPEQLAQIATALASMEPAQRAAMAATMGIPPEQLQAITALGSMLQSGGGAPGGPRGPPAAPPGSTVIHLTTEEKASVDRLQALGFSRQAVLEAYLACDKNEEMAANFLFENSA